MASFVHALLPFKKKEKKGGGSGDICACSGLFHWTTWYLLRPVDSSSQLLSRRVNGFCLLGCGVKYLGQSTRHCPCHQWRESAALLPISWLSHRTYGVSRANIEVLNKVQYCSTGIHNHWGQRFVPGSGLIKVDCTTAGISSVLFAVLRTRDCRSDGFGSRENKNGNKA
jgi:hypothetical protein